MQKKLTNGIQISFVIHVASARIISWKTLAGTPLSRTLSFTGTPFLFVIYDS